MKNIRVGIVGASGYTGSELVRILINHPNTTIEYITSESSAGKPFADLHEAFHSIMELPLIKVEDALKHEVDVVFLALPHGVSMNYAPKFLEKGNVVIGCRQKHFGFVHPIFEENRIMESGKKGVQFWKSDTLAFFKKRRK